MVQSTVAGPAVQGCKARRQEEAEQAGQAAEAADPEVAPWQGWPGTRVWKAILRSLDTRLGRDYSVVVSAAEPASSYTWRNKSLW